MVTDTLGRPLRDLRVSVTDRCNFRCTYCMPKEVFGRDYQFLSRDEILTFEEIERVVRIAVGLGVEKVRLTGGEPTVRHGLPDLVRMLAAIDGLRDLTMTTNATLLSRPAPEARPAHPEGTRRMSGAGTPPQPTLATALREAGLHRITVSLDSLDDATFRAMNDVDFPVERVVEGIEAAHSAGFSPIKINAVIKRGVNEDAITELPARFQGPDYIVRFIEYMDVGHTNGWRLDDVVPAKDILERLDAATPIEPADPNYPGEVATRWRFKDGSGEVGVIASVTRPFCGACTRLRLSADGNLYTCLFAIKGHDLRTPLRTGSTDDDLTAQLAAIWTVRKDRYSELRTAGTPNLERVEMSYIGG